jgi:hypothetical protein
MKISAWTLIMVVSLGLSSPIFAAGQEDLDHHVTGTITKIEPLAVILDTGGPGTDFYLNTAFDTAEKHLKIGQR